MKFFNTAGPVNQKMHYKVDPLTRWDFEEIMFLINQWKYFILHAPRQTGKTSSMLAFQDYLNKTGNYNAIYMNVEVGQAARNDIKSGIKSIVNELSKRTNDAALLDVFKTSGENDALNAALTILSEKSEKPVVLFIDEIDALIGDTLISVLRQIRAGYDKRPEKFPIALVLCGVRDIKDYRIHRSDDDIITGGSAFNIKAESLRLGNFTREDVEILLMEHTKETGQKFEDSVYDCIFDYTDGQPWLVNAIAFEVTFKMKENRDRALLITENMVIEAINRVTLSRATHLDQLSDKLKEDRVRRVVLPMILNGEVKPHYDDKQYCIDLGLIKDSERGLVIANKIYQEIIPRELTEAREDDFKMRFDPDWIDADGMLDTETLFNMFTQFWRENSEIWASNIKGYEEAAPHLVFQAYLQRVANGKGFVAREYGLGRKRTDLMLRWTNGKKEQRVVIELKVMRAKDSYKSVREIALKQTAEYSKRLDGTENHIIVFDRDGKRDWREKIFTEFTEYDGMKVKIWGV